MGADVDYAPGESIAGRCSRPRPVGDQVVG
jgi:hypothetical protein